METRKSTIHGPPFHYSGIQLDTLKEAELFLQCLTSVNKSADIKEDTQLTALCDRYNIQCPQDAKDSLRSYLTGERILPEDAVLAEALAEQYEQGVVRDEYRKNKYKIRLALQRRTLFAMRQHALKTGTHVVNFPDALQENIVVQNLQDAQRLPVNSKTGVIGDFSSLNNSVRWPVAFPDGSTEAGAYFSLVEATGSDTASKVFQGLGIYYIFRFFVNCVMVLKNAYLNLSPEEEAEQELWKRWKAFCRRLGKNLQKDGRGNVMLNDLVWGAINGACFFALFVTTGGLSPLLQFILNVGGGASSM